MSNRNTLIMLDVASRFGGVCTRADLIAAGVPSSTIDSRLQADVLRLVTEGVYVIESLMDDTTPLHRATKSIPGSVVSHDSGAHVMGFPVKCPDTAHVLADNGTHRVIDGVRVHRTRRWPTPDQLVTIGSLVITSPARTILDLSTTGMSTARLRHIIQVQATKNDPEPTELMGLFCQLNRRGVPGTRRMRRLMADLFDAEPVPASELENRVAELLRVAGLNGFGRQVRPPWFDGRRGIVDFADTHNRVIIEADGRRWHATEQAMAEDRRRDRQAAANGWTVLRVSWAELMSRPESIVDDIRSVLGRANVA